MHRLIRRFPALALASALPCLVSACAAPAPQKAALVISAPAAPHPAPSIPPATPAPAQVAAGPAVTGTASWYRTGRDLHRTYSGQALNNNAFTAASTVLPMGTLVRVGRVDDNRSVVVRVNDRMPHNRRLIDVSQIAARKLGLMGCGVATVTVTPVKLASAP